MGLWPYLVLNVHKVDDVVAPVESGISFQVQLMSVVAFGYVRGTELGGHHELGSIVVCLAGSNRKKVVAEVVARVRELDTSLKKSVQAVKIGHTRRHLI